MKGRVISADTRQPVVFANVFLSNTSIGTLTNENGEFVINRFPAGRYDLVVSSIGYETVIRSVQSGNLTAALEISLKPRTEELKEVIVEAYEKDGWEKWGKIFTDNFIGTSSFASDCHLLNRDALKFRFSKKRNVVRVSADEPLVIENRAMGYLVKYDLTKFEYNLTDRSFIYQGYPFFEEMQSDRSSQLKKWTTNRQDAYAGSTMHFMRALFQKRLAEEKFEVRRVFQLSEEEKQRVEKLYKTLSSKTPPPEKVTFVNGANVAVLKSNPALADSLDYYKQVRERAVGSSIVRKQLLPADSISFPIDAFTVGLSSEERLHVIYLPKKNLPEFQKYLPRYSINAVVSSEIFPVPGTVITVLPNGSYFEGINLSFSGYWGWWGKICNKLPYDYTPPVK